MCIRDRNTATQLQQYQSEWQQKMSDIKNNTIKSLQELVDNASQKGSELVTKFVSAITAAIPQLDTAFSGLNLLGGGTSSDSQIAEAQKQKTGVLNAATEQKTGVIQNTIQTVQTVLQQWNTSAQQLTQVQTDIKTKTLNIWNNIQQGLNNLWLKISNDLQKTWNDMRSFLFDVLKSVEDKFNYMIESSNNWGIRLMDNFIAGVYSKFSDLEKTLEQMSQMVDAYMPHSPAKKGALSRLNEYGPALVNTFAKGIVNSLPALENATNKMTSSFSMGTLNPALATGSRTVNQYGGNTIYINVTGNNASDQADALLRELRKRGVKF